MTDRKAVACEIANILPFLLHRFGTELRRSIAGMDASHFRMLVVLAAHPHSLSDLASRQGISLATISKTVATLVDRGWVQRLPDAQDRRVVRVSLTPLGRDILKSSYRQILVSISEMLSTMDEDNLTKVHGGLVALEEALRGKDEFWCAHHRMMGEELPIIGGTSEGDP